MKRKSRLHRIRDITLALSVAPTFGACSTTSNMVKSFGPETVEVSFTGPQAQREHCYIKSGKGMYLDAVRQTFNGVQPFSEQAIEDREQSAQERLTQCLAKYELEPDSDNFFENDPQLEEDSQEVDLS